MQATPAKVTHNELIKEANPSLAGTIKQTLLDPNVDRFSEDDSQFLKFHGIYQQDDRDLRKTGRDRGDHAVGVDVAARPPQRSAPPALRRP